MRSSYRGMWSTVLILEAIQLKRSLILVKNIRSLFANSLKVMSPAPFSRLCRSDSTGAGACEKSAKSSGSVKDYAGYHLCVYIYIYIYTPHTHTLTNMYKRSHIYTLIYKHTCIYTYIYTHTYIHIDTNIYTHIQCITKVSTPLIFLQIFKYISSWDNTDKMTL